MGKLHRTYDPKNREQVLRALRREILAAQLKVTLDEQLGRTTSRQVKELAEMKLPPLIRTTPTSKLRSTQAKVYESMSQAEEMAAGSYGQ